MGGGDQVDIHYIKYYWEKRLLSRMNWIVALIMFLLASLLNWGCPYKQIWIRSFEFWASISLSNKILLIFSIKGTLFAENNEHLSKKWCVSSLAEPQSHLLEGVSMKLWSYLCLFSGLRPTLSSYNFLMPIEWWLPKILFWDK